MDESPGGAALRIDWGDVQPSDAERVDAEARFSDSPVGSAGIVALRRRGSGYEAQLRMRMREPSTGVRLHGDSIAHVVARLAELLEIISEERSRWTRSQR